MMIGSKMIDKISLFLNFYPPQILGVAVCAFDGAFH